MSLLAISILFKRISDPHKKLMLKDLPLPCAVIVGPKRWLYNAQELSLTADPTLAEVCWGVSPLWDSRPVLFVLAQGPQSNPPMKHRCSTTNGCLYISLNSWSPAAIFMTIWKYGIFLQNKNILLYFNLLLKLLGFTRQNPSFILIFQQMTAILYLMFIATVGFVT